MTRTAHPRLHVVPHWLCSAAFLSLSGAPAQSHAPPRPSPMLGPPVIFSRGTESSGIPARKALFLTVMWYTPQLCFIK